MPATFWRLWAKRAQFLHFARATGGVVSASHDDALIQCDGHGDGRVRLPDSETFYEKPQEGRSVRIGIVQYQQTCSLLRRFILESSSNDCQL